MSEFDEKSFENILEEMSNDFKEKSGFSPDNASDIGIRLKVLAAQIFSLNHKLNFAWKQSSPLTATGEYLERHAYEKGIERKKGKKAQGKVKFYLSEPILVDKAIEKGTIIATNTFSNAVKFQTTENAVLVAGETEILVNAEAQEIGIEGNVSAGALKIIGDNIHSSLSVTNPEAFIGGTQAETDEQLRKRIVNSYQLPVMNGNESYYINVALEDEDVISASVIPCARGAGTVDVAIATSDPLPSSTVLSRLQKVFDDKKEFGIDVKVISPKIYSVNFLGDISILNGYSPEETENKCKNILEEYVGSLGVGESFIKVNLFKRIMEVSGVKNIELYKPSEDMNVSGDTLIRCGNVNFNIIK